MNENSGQAFDDFVRKSIDGAAIDFNPSAWEELSAQLDVFDRAINEKKSLIEKLKSWMSLSLNSFFVVLLGLGGLFVIVASANQVTSGEINGLMEQFTKEVEDNGLENENNPSKNQLVPIESTNENGVESRRINKKRTSKERLIPSFNDVLSTDSVPVKDTIKEKDVFIFW